jgi:hypothetical protein
MTAQEAAISHPNEMGLLGGFVKSIAAAAKRAGQGFQSFLGRVHGKLRAAKEHVRKYRLSAKGKTKAGKDRMVAQMTRIIEGINQNLGKAIAAASAQGRKLRGHAQVAQRKLVELYPTMGKLIPQIRHWLRTGFVAATDHRGVFARMQRSVNQSVPSWQPVCGDPPRLRSGCRGQSSPGDARVCPAASDRTGSTWCKSHPSCPCG